MEVKSIVDEDFVNYKKPSMFIIMPYCTFKCDKEYGTNICQNSSLSNLPVIDISIDTICERYLNNPITHAVVLGGLEPFCSYEDLQRLITALRSKTDDDIVIYTGYNKDEIIDKVNWLNQFKNIIIKFGRFIPNQEKHLDEVLGIELASNNQYAEVLNG